MASWPSRARATIETANTVSAVPIDHRVRPASAAENSAATTGTTSIGG